jgi:hypothetical protein
MNLKRLFQVLVVGGQMVGCSTTRTGKLVSSDASGDVADGSAGANDDGQTGSADVGRDEAPDTGGSTDTAPADSVEATDALASDLPADDSRESDATITSDGAITSDATITSDAAAADGPRRLCLCNTTPSCCETHSDGTKGPVLGVECCWATTC